MIEDKTMDMKPVVSQDEINEKKRDYKLNKLKKLVKDNSKSARGFGYEYKPIQFPEN